MFQPYIELIQSFSIPLPVISFIWLVAWGVFKYFAENNKKYAISDYEQLQRLESEMESLETKGALHQDMSIRSITVLKGFTLKEVKFLLSRTKLNVLNIDELKKLKRGIWLQVWFDDAKGFYQDNYPRQTFTFLISTVVIFLAYAGLLILLMNYWQMQPKGLNLIGMLIAIGIVEVPVINNFSKYIELNKLSKETDLFVP